jgi:hypothetical protein
MNKQLRRLERDLMTASLALFVVTMLALLAR